MGSLCCVQGRGDCDKGFVGGRGVLEKCTATKARQVTNEGIFCFIRSTAVRYFFLRGQRLMWLVFQQMVNIRPLIIVIAGINF